MNETLKAAGHIGAELAEAKAEIQRQRERHRTTWAQLEQVTGLLREFAEYLPYPGQIERITAALSQQTEQQPVCWASSAALAKLQNGRNNSPCVLTDGPAEFNDTPLYAAPIAQTAPQQLGPNGSADRYFFAQGFEHGKRAAAPQPEQSVPEGYVLMPKQCPSWLEDAYDECCEADGHHGAGLYLPAYDAMVAALSATPAMDSQQ